jgi:hypothetical protein
MGTELLAFRVGVDTTVTLDGSPVKPEDLKAGDVVAVSAEAEGGFHNATTVAARRPT